MAGELVLIVEDIPTNLRLASVVLKAAGFEVDSAATAREALEKVRARRPAVILMDVELPEMDGLTATRQLKGDPATASIPVVALTANAMRGDRERCLEAGCDGYISKPFDTHALPGTVRSYIRDD